MLHKGTYGWRERERYIITGIGAVEWAFPIISSIMVLRKFKELFGNAYKGKKRIGLVYMTAFGKIAKIINTKFFKSLSNCVLVDPIKGASTLFHLTKYYIAPFDI